MEQGISPIERPEQVLDWSSLTMITVNCGDANSDFRVDELGFTRLLVYDLGDDLGALVQRLLEIEAYRPFALLGLPTALERAPSVDRIDHRHVEVLEEMRRDRKSVPLWRGV